jgi:hypothetical protein
MCSPAGVPGHDRVERGTQRRHGARLPVRLEQFSVDRAIPLTLQPPLSQSRLARHSNIITSALAMAARNSSALR